MSKKYLQTYFLILRLHAVEAKYGDDIIKVLRESGLATKVAVIGQVVPKKEKLIYVR